MRTRFFIFFALFALSVSGCSVNFEGGEISIENVSEESVNIKTEPALQVGGEWETAASGIERMEYIAAVEPTVRLLMYKFDAEKFDWRFEQHTQGRFIDDWYTELNEPVAVFNALYFLENNEPAGLFITGGDTMSGNIFDYSRSALLSLRPEFGIIDTADAIPNLDTYTEAGQSYPLLIRGGEAAVEEDSGRVSRRTFIGQDEEGDIYVGIVPNTSVSLFELAHYVANMPVEWGYVLNLDGGTSTGLYANNGEISDEINSFVPVPNVLVIEEKR